MGEDWDKRASGLDCPFDDIQNEGNEFLAFIKKLSISSLYLDKNQTYRGHCLLIFNPRHITRIDQLTPDEWGQLSRDIYSAEVAIYKTFKPDHMNIENLGNIVPHLHWHIIPRYKDDIRWGAPVWTSTQEELSRLYLTEIEYRKLANDIISNL